MMPSYSALIPAYNASGTIAETIGAILGQSVPPAEIVVVDDGSTDDTVAVASAIDQRVRVVRQQQSGPGKASNTAVANATCDIIAFSDADDIWLPHKMEVQLPALAAAERRIVMARMQHVRNGVLGRVQDARLRSVMVLRRTDYAAVGDMIDPPGNRGDIVDWLARAREIGFELALIEEVLAYRRIHAGSLSYGRDEDKDRGYLHAARQALIRKRRQGSGPE